MKTTQISKVLMAAALSISLSASVFAAASMVEVNRGAAIEMLNNPAYANFAGAAKSAVISAEASVFSTPASTAAFVQSLAAKSGVTLDVGSLTSEVAKAAGEVNLDKVLGTTTTADSSDTLGMLAAIQNGTANDENCSITAAVGASENPEFDQVKDEVQQLAAMAGALRKGAAVEVAKESGEMLAKDQQATRGYSVLAKQLVPTVRPLVAAAVADGSVTAEETNEIACGLARSAKAAGASDEAALNLAGHCATPILGVQGANLDSCQI